MKKIITFSVLFLFIIGFGQTHRFIYELHFKSDSTKNKTDSVKMVLDIGKEETKFYDIEFLRIDSIRKIKNENWMTNSITQQLLKRKNGSNFNQNYKDNLFDYFLVESNDEMKWNVFPETKNVANYHLQKAETNFGGRHWVAWFTAEIPISEGPYKFRGLPGLVFEVSDVGNNYSYKLVNSTTLDVEVDTNDFLETHYGEKPIKIAAEKLNELQINYYNDPYSWARTATGNWNVNFGDGVNYNKKEDIPYLTKRTQEELRRNNNPVELDTAVKYPLK
ncbi:GLPGLI family protein [Chryseobacterium sp. SC28]|uniref:GLPGLI family protein n=1 Tax=Chryseobacterium sp. SC28 TaxID=2268028 RepID=UPI000F64C5C3|nr:GLPGLI family protein [Chryseobacterium sp. SC28]RRQ45535.1 GLPGLI family protein [Chryseobacterium sp. SC28]